MGAIIQGAGTSELRWNAQRLEISLSRQVFGEMWDTVVARLIDAWGSRSFFTWTQPTMTVRGKGADAPRWKVHPLDVLSGLFFLLKVPANHELVRLWAVIDWSAINALCATPYHNAHGGPHAWAPAQMVALLVLMFLHGVPHETTLLCRVRENIVWCWFCGFGLFGPWPDHSTLYTFRQRLGVELFECVLTIAVQACIEAGLVANELIHFDLTAVVASGHRWSPYERAVLLSKALIRYLEQIWADQMPEEPFPEALRMLAAEVALESLPHKRLQEVAPERVAQSVADWDGQTNPEQTAWQTTLEEAVQEELATTDEPFVQDMSTQAVVTWLSRVCRTHGETRTHAWAARPATPGSVATCWALSSTAGTTSSPLWPGRQATSSKPRSCARRWRSTSSACRASPRGPRWTVRSTIPMCMPAWMQQASRATSPAGSIPSRATVGLAPIAWRGMPASGNSTVRTGPSCSHKATDGRDARPFWEPVVSTVLCTLNAFPVVMEHPKPSPWTPRTTDVGSRIESTARRTPTRLPRKPALSKKVDSVWPK